MPTFYYIAVSGSDHRRIAGQINALSENSARAELNKIGLSVLSIGTTPFDAPKSKASKTFEFEATDRFKKTVAGTIDARDALMAFERLSTEFKFNVHYLCLADASAEEKKIARENGIKRLAAAENQKKSLELARQKPILKMSLKEIVERAEEKMKKGEIKTSFTELPVENEASNDWRATNEESSLAELESAAQAVTASQISASDKPKKIILDDAKLALRAVENPTDQKAEFSEKDFEFSTTTPGVLGASSGEPQKQQGFKESDLAELQLVATDKVPTADEAEVSGRSIEESALVTQETTKTGIKISLLSPLTWKGDRDGKASKKGMQLLSDHQIESVEEDVETSDQQMATDAENPTKTTFATQFDRVLDTVNFSFSRFEPGRFKGAFSATFNADLLLPARAAVGEVLTGVLAVFFCSFAVLSICARLALGDLSEFSGNVITHSTIFAFLLFAILLLRLFIWLQGTFQKHQLQRTVALYALGTVLLGVLYVNVGY